MQHQNLILNSDSQNMKEVIATFLLLLDIAVHSIIDDSRRLPYHTAYLQDSCTCKALYKLSCDSFTLPDESRGAGHVALSRDSHFYREFYCQFTIQAPPQKKVQLVINTVSLPRTRDCKEASLQLFDGYMDEVNTWPMAVLCGDKAQTTLFRSTKSAVTFYYQQGNSVLWDKKKFNITYTFFDIPKLGDPCSNISAEFQCQNKLCISRDLLCDDVDNCIDQSDESLHLHVCGKRVSKSNPAVSMGVGGGVFLVLSLVFAISVIFGFRRHQQKRRSHYDDVAENSSPSIPVQNGATHPLPQENIMPLVPMYSTQDGATVAAQHLIVPDITRDLPPEAGRPGVRLVGIVEIHPVPHNPRSATPPPPYSALFPDQV